MSQIGGVESQPTSGSGERLALALLLAAPLLISSNPIIGRAAVDIVPPVALAFWRWAVAALILLPFTWFGLVRHATVLRRHILLIGLLGSLGMGVCGAFVYIGLQHTTATTASIIYAISPVMMLVIVWLFEREPIRLHQIIGVTIAIVGVLVIVSRGALDQLLAITFNIGDLWVLGSAASWAVYSVLLRRLTGLLPTFTLFTAIVLAGVLSLAPFYAIETAMGRPVVWNQEAAISIAGVALLASVLAFSAFQKGIALVGAARSGPFMYLMPVYGVILATLFLGEAFAIFHGAGLLLVISGVALASRR